MLLHLLLFSLFPLPALLSAVPTASSDGADGGFAPYWAVELVGGPPVAMAIARRRGLEYHGEILPGIFHFKLPSRPQRVKRSQQTYRPELERLLLSDIAVVWAQQQRIHRRVKRSAAQVFMNDEKWTKMWYLDPELPRRRHSGRLPAPSMNIAGAWQLGFHGQGVVVCVLDDGIEKEHPDLRENYDAEASFDVNNNDPDPTFRPTARDENKHGTRCAGQIAAQANNSICIPGVAFRSRIGAIRMLDGEITDTVETLSVGYRPQHIHVYSSSWGPSDDGATLEGPGRLTQKAFSLGVALGRSGLGSVFVWASGNGGRDDNCNTDGYTNSIYTLSVGAVSESGAVPWYSESCSSTLAVTYSSGDSGLQERSIVTTDLHGRCTENHTGTSASAPIAAGIVSLALSANPYLGWRDLQHLTVRSSNPSPYLRTTWRINGVGRKVSHEFGYGLMDALAMVRLAQNWRLVPRLRSCDAGSKEGLSAVIDDGFERAFRLQTDACASSGTEQEVAFVEHVQARVALTATRRGGVQLWLHSPLGTVSQLLSRRPKDKNKGGFHLWPFMTVHNWGEPPRGTWQLVIRCDGCTATLHSWSLLIHGTGDLPAGQAMPAVTKPAPHQTAPINEDYTIERNSQITQLPIIIFKDNAANAGVSLTLASNLPTSAVLPLILLLLKLCNCKQRFFHT